MIVKGIGALVCDDTGYCYDDGTTSQSINPSSMTCTCVAGTCAENGNSCAGGSYGGSGTPVYPGGNPANSSIWLAISNMVRSATGILGSRYAVPQLNPGQYIQSGPGGTVMYQGSPTSGVPSGLPSLSNLGGSSMLPLLLVGGVVLFAMSRK